EEVRDKSLDLLRLLPEVAGGPDQPSQLVLRRSLDRLRRQHPGRLQPGDRLLDVAPGGVLHQERPDNHLERALGRPPVLRTVGGEKAGVQVEEGKSRIWNPESRRRPVLPVNEPCSSPGISATTGLRVERPTSGFWVLGSRLRRHTAYVAT